MSSISPNAIKRRTNSRIAASHPKVKRMEQKAHNSCLINYSNEIFEHLTELEERTKLKPGPILLQPDITLEMRPVLFDFLVEVHNKLKLSNTTFYLMINIIDRYCSLRRVKKEHFQLLGLTALWLAAKFSELTSKVPNVNFLRATCCDCYSKKLFSAMELHILKSLEWEIGSAGHDAFIDLMLREKLTSEAISIDEINSIKFASNYLCQLMQFYPDITFRYSVSQIAMASVLIASVASNYTTHDDFFHYKFLTKKSTKLNEMIESILTILRKKTVPKSLRMKFFDGKDDLRANLTLNSIYQYSKEVDRLKSSPALLTPVSTPQPHVPTSLVFNHPSPPPYCPQTPSSMCSTPSTSKHTSTMLEPNPSSISLSSCSDSTNLSKTSLEYPTPSSDVSINTMLTPPYSSASSPITIFPKARTSLFRRSLFSDARASSANEFKIVAPQNCPTENESTKGGTDKLQASGNSDHTIKKRSLEI